MQLSHNTVVLVADGRKLLFLRNEGDATNPHLDRRHTPRRTEEPRHARPGDRSGRAACRRRRAATGSAVGATDFPPDRGGSLRRAQAADLLKRRALSNDFESLIVVAPPRIRWANCASIITRRSAPG